MNLKTQKKDQRRARMVQTHGRHCCWCGDRMTWPDYRADAVPASTDMTFEHLLPQAMGGGNGPDNMKLACYACNNERGTAFQFEPLRRWSFGPPQVKEGAHG